MGLLRLPSMFLARSHLMISPFWLNIGISSRLALGHDGPGMLGVEGPSLRKFDTFLLHFGLINTFSLLLGNSCCAQDIFSRLQSSKGSKIFATYICKIDMRSSLQAPTTTRPVTRVGTQLANSPSLGSLDLSPINPINPKVSPTCSIHSHQDPEYPTPSKCPHLAERAIASYPSACIHIRQYTTQHSIYSSNPASVAVDTYPSPSQGSSYSGSCTRQNVSGWDEV